MKKNLIAAIDIGTRTVRMRISEAYKNGKLKEIDSFTRAVPLGHNAFMKQKIDFETVDILCEILSNYKQVIDEYRISEYSIMATSAIREAKNKNYIIDQIRIKTGFNISVIDKSEEQFLTLNAIRLRLDNFEELTDEGLIVVCIGGGSIQLAAYKGGKLTSSNNIKLGALRIKEMLEPIKAKNINYRDVLKEYISLYLDRLDEIKNETYKHLVVLGSEADLIAEVLDTDKSIINKKEILKVYKEVEYLSEAEMLGRYNIESEQASILFPLLALLKQFIKVVEGDELIISNLSLIDGMLFKLQENSHKLGVDHRILEDILTSAKNLAKRYSVDREHFEYVDFLSAEIFKKLSKVHGLKNELLFLSLASVLHEIGASINISEYGQNTYEILRMLDIFGISEEGRELIAIISKFAGNLIPENTDVDFSSIDSSNHITAAKLIAILKLANSLDIGFKQKIKIKSIRLKDKVLVIRGESKRDTSLEEWDFADKSLYFKEVFGIDAKLIIKRDI